VFDLLLTEGDLADALDSLRRICLVRCGKATLGGAGGAGSAGLNTAASETLELVRALALDRALGELDAIVLEVLVCRHDDRILAAHETYRASQDLEDFVDTLRHIAQLAAPAEAAAARDAATRQAQTEAQLHAAVGAAPAPAPVRGLSRDAGVEEDAAILDTMFTLVAAGQLAPADAGRLAELLPDRDPRLLAAFDVFRVEGDVVDFADSLRRIFAHVAAADAAPPAQASAAPPAHDSAKVKGDAESLGSGATITDDEYEWVSDEDDEDEASANPPQHKPAPSNTGIV
jgi:hypothetical protein